MPWGPYLLSFVSAPAEAVRGSSSDSLHSPPLNPLPSARAPSSPPLRHCVPRPSVPSPTRSLRFPSNVASALPPFLLFFLACTGRERQPSMRCKPRVLHTKHRPICFHFLPVFRFEFLSLLSTLIAVLPRIFPPPSSFSSPPFLLFCFLSLIPSLQSFRATVRCSKLSPAVRWPWAEADDAKRLTLHTFKHRQNPQKTTCDPKPYEIVGYDRL